MHPLTFFRSQAFTFASSQPVSMWPSHPLSPPISITHLSSCFVSLPSQANPSGFFPRCMTQMPLSMNMTKSSAALPLMIQIANVKKQWQQSCSGLTQHTLWTSEQLSCGRCICSSETFQSISEDNWTRVHVNMWCTFHHCQILLMTSWKTSMLAGRHRRRVSSLIVDGSWCTLSGNSFLMMTSCMHTNLRW